MTGLQILVTVYRTRRPDADLRPRVDPRMGGIIERPQIYDHHHKIVVFWDTEVAIEPKTPWDDPTAPPPVHGPLLTAMERAHRHHHALDYPDATKIPTLTVTGEHPGVTAEPDLRVQVLEEWQRTQDGRGVLLVQPSLQALWATQHAIVDDLLTARGAAFAYLPDALHPHLVRTGVREFKPARFLREVYEPYQHVFEAVRLQHDLADEPGRPMPRPRL